VQEALEGAFTHISGFVERRVRRLLLVEDDEVSRQGIQELLSGEDVEIVVAPDGARALQELEKGEFDTVVLDLVLPDQDGMKLLEEIKTQPRFRDLPVVVYTGKELAPREEQRLKKYAESVILKSGVASPEKLRSDTALFLHRVEEKLPENAKNLLKRSREEGDRVAGRKVPREDGYALVTQLRQLDPPLPVAALTAYASPDDHQKALEAGFQAHVTKPIDRPTWRGWWSRSRAMRRCRRRRAESRVGVEGSGFCLSTLNSRLSTR